MLICENFKNIIKKRKVPVQKFKPFFVTTDGRIHECADYNWCIADRINCTIPQFIMIDIKSDGYIEDEYGVMYPLTNVVSIKWELLEERIVEDNFGEYNVTVTTEELEDF